MRINELLLVAVPGEMSTEMGQRLKQLSCRPRHTRQALRMSPLLAGESIYLVFHDPEEYALQYEGASTLYGPASGPVIAARLGYLVAQMAALTTPPALPSQWIFRPGLKVQAFPEVLSMQGGREAQRSHWIAVPRLRASFVWQDLSPGTISFDAPLVHLETQSRDGRWVPLFVDALPVDDRGLHLGYATFGKRRSQGRRVAGDMVSPGTSRYPPFCCAPVAPCRRCTQSRLRSRRDGRARLRMFIGLVRRPSYWLVPSAAMEGC